MPPKRVISRLPRPYPHAEQMQMTSKQMLPAGLDGSVRTMKRILRLMTLVIQILWILLPRAKRRKEARKENEE